MMKTKADKDIEDLEFIISEVVRFASMDAKTMIAYLGEHKNDFGSLCLILEMTEAF